MFMLSIVPLPFILKKENTCYKWWRKEQKLNELLFMDDLKLYAKSGEQTNTLVRTVYMFNTDIDMEFEIPRILLMKEGKIIKSDEIKLPDGKVMKQFRQEGYTYIGIIELDKIKETEMTEKITNECKRTQILILKSKLNGKIKVTVTDTWVVAVFRYGARIIQWKGSKLKDLNRK